MRGTPLKPVALENVMHSIIWLPIFSCHKLHKRALARSLARSNHNNEWRKFLRRLLNRSAFVLRANNKKNEIPASKKGMHKTSRTILILQWIFRWQLSNSFFSYNKDHFSCGFCSSFGKWLCKFPTEFILMTRKTLFIALGQKIMQKNHNIREISNEIDLVVMHVLYFKRSCLAA